MDYWRCENGELHDWEYLGRTVQAYRCRGCQVKVSKADFKAATDA